MKCFTEVTIADGYGEFMVHLVEGEPVALYVYREDLHVTLPYAPRESNPESELYDSRNYKPGLNPLFIHAKSKAFVRRMWNGYLERFYNPETD